MKSKTTEKETASDKNFINSLRSIKFNKTKKFLLYYLYFSNLIIISNSIQSSIILTITGPGTKDISYGSQPRECYPYFDKPNEVYVNKVKKDQFLSQYDFDEGDNEVILIWNKTVTSCNCLFNFCKDIKEINFSNFDTSNVKYMNNMFNESSSLTSLDLSNFETSELEDTENMFLFCSSLKYINISSFKTPKLKYMTNMFAACESLTSLDLSNFDTSQVINMGSLFSGCGNLTSLNLSSFKTGNVQIMCAMFYGCTSLISLNLENFDTSKVIDMFGLFGYCFSLTSINISVFKTGITTNMEQLFYKCSSLTSIDLSNFDTSEVTSFKEMFCDCSKLKIFNLSNFNISKISNMDNMFSNCSKLEYINLENAIIQLGSITMNDIISNTSLNLVVCSFDNLLINKVKENECAIIDCSEKWKENRKKIIVSNNTCIDDCTLVLNTFDYDSKCYDICPSGSYNYIYLYSEDDYDIHCSNTLEGLYYDEKDSIYKLCYPSCKSCIKEGDEYNHYCLECKKNYFYQDNYLNYSNCYQNCSKYYYYDNSTKALHCTNSFECPINYNKFIFNKKECLDKCENDINYKYEYNNECYIQCPNGTINNSFQCINISNPEDSTKIIISTNNNIDEMNDSTNIINEIHDSTVIDNNNKIIIYFKNGINFTLDQELNQENYYEIQKGKLSVKLISTYFFKKNKNINMTIIDLGLCENVLKDFYNISYNSSLYLLMFEIIEEGMKINKVEYEVYHKLNENNLLLLNLTLCQNERLEISNYVDINDNVDKYNSSSGYYNDLCYPTTSNYGTDICLKDRRKEFIDNNLTLCEENCDFIDYDYIYKRAKCSCDIKINLPLLSLIEDIKFDKEKLKKNFVDINNIANFKFLRCYETAFKSENLKLNYGFYLLDFIFGIFLICLFLFYFKYYYSFIDKVKKLVVNLINNNNKIEHMNTSNKNIVNSNQIIDSNDGKNNILKLKKNNINNKINFGNKKNKPNNFFEKQNKTEIYDKSKSKNNLFSIINKKEIKNINNNLNYTDLELNSLSYKEALKFDRRTFIQYYFSLLKHNHSFLFSFYPNNDYNSRIIKIFLFFYSFASELFINALFFNDSTMHQIYEDQGSFNFIYQIPQIIYSSISSMIINYIIKLLSLTNGNITDLKEAKKKNEKNIEKKVEKLYKILKIKFALFFIFAFFLLGFFEYYITCFCGVYVNTQIHLIKDTLLSLLISLLYPFATFILLSLFRRIALQAKNKDRELLYKFSQLLENL